MTMTLTSFVFVLAEMLCSESRMIGSLLVEIWETVSLPLDWPLALAKLKAGEASRIRNVLYAASFHIFGLHSCAHVGILPI